MGFIENFLRGRAIAEQEHQQETSRNQQQEDRKIQLEELDIRRKQLRLAQKKEQLGLMQGQPAPEVKAGEPGTFRTPESIGEGLQAQMMPIEQGFTKELALPGVTFGPDEGFDSSFEVRPTSLQEALRRQMGQKVFESQLKRDENTYTVTDPTTGKPITGPKDLLDNVITQTGEAARHEAGLKAQSERAASDRASRENIAEENRKAAAARALVSGKQSKTVTQAMTLANRFDTHEITKRYNILKEAAQFVQSMDPDTSNPGDDQGLIYSFAKAMDPDSVVREGEYATVQKYAQSWANNFQFNAARIYSNSPFLSPEARQNMKNTILGKAKVIESGYLNLRNEAKKKFAEIGEDPASWLTDYGSISGKPGGGGAPNPYR